VQTPCPRATQPGKNGGTSIPTPLVPGVPDFGSLSFENAIELFREWGFQVEPGPRPEEVTLILEGPSYRSYWVHDAHALAGIAAMALRLRWQSGMLGRQLEGEGGDHRGAGRELARLAC